MILVKYYGILLGWNCLLINTFDIKTVIPDPLKVFEKTGHKSLGQIMQIVRGKMITDVSLGTILWHFIFYSTSTVGISVESVLLNKCI